MRPWVNWEWKGSEAREGVGAQGVMEKETGDVRLRSRVEEVIQ